MSLASFQGKATRRARVRELHLTAVPAGGSRPECDVPALSHRVAFLVVYIGEAHPSDAWQVPSNVKGSSRIAGVSRPTVRNAPHSPASA